MIESYERKLNDDDIKYLNKKYQSQEKQLIYRNEKIIKYIPFYSAAFLIGAAAFFTLLYKRSDSFLVFLTGTVFIGTPFVLFRLIRSFVKNNMLQGKLHRILDDILEKDTAQVIHCKSKKMIEFEEIEDEGTQYLFQVEENKVFNIAGKEYRETNLFPSSDFELVSIIGKDDDSPVDFHIHCIGHKLSPIMVITADVKKEHIKTIAELPKTIDGSIEDLDSVMNIILK